MKYSSSYNLFNSFKLKNRSKSCAKVHINKDRTKYIMNLLSEFNNN